MLTDYFLFTEEELKKAKSRQPLPCKCESCGKTFHKPKNQILSIIKRKRNEHIYCSRSCKCSKTLHSDTIYCNVKCDQCGKEIMRTEAWIKKVKHNFCSRSCAAKYQNAHKTSGYRRSKLEMYLEAKLAELYLDLEILYNDRQTLGNGLELDIYIPSRKLAFELNGPFHYIAAFGQGKLDKIQNNDSLKLQKCLELDIDLCVIDVSQQKYFTEKSSQKYLDIIKQFLK